jgi:hypothetical protein
VREVTLLRVVDSHDETFEAYRYLSNLRHRPELTHLRSWFKVECGYPAERIANMGRDQLVALTTPQRSSRFPRGSLDEP